MFPSLPYLFLVSSLSNVPSVRQCMLVSRLALVTQHASERSLGVWPGPIPMSESRKWPLNGRAERGRTKDRGDARRGSRDDRPDPAFVRIPAIVRFDPAQVRGRRPARPSTPDNAYGAPVQSGRAAEYTDPLKEGCWSTPSSDGQECLAVCR